MIKSKNNINTGKLLNEFLSKNKIPKTELSKQIGRGQLSVSNYTRNDSIQTQILIDICYATKRNFFQDIANRLPNDFTASDNLISEKDKLIAQLQEENKVLKIQNDVLMKLRG